MTTERDTLRVFYAPKEKTTKAYDEAMLQLRIAELEVKTAALTRELSERTQDLLEALDELERRGLA